MNPQPGILYARSLHESVNKLTKEEQKLCGLAIDKFRNDPWLSGLNFEYLGKRPAHNHHSILASKELRIILRLELKKSLTPGFIGNVELLTPEDLKKKLSQSS